MTTVYRESGERLHLDPNDALGSGGEGTVWIDPSDPSQLLKVYEVPTVTHGNKLKAFLLKYFSLPKNVAVPQTLLYDQNGKIIGYTMRYVKNAKPFKDLANVKFRNRQRINNKQVITLHQNDAQVLTKIHQQHIVIGDRNDRNILFSGSDSFYIDFDSVQFDNWPCPVATENFLDPNLYGLNLSQKPVFQPGNDWYSYSAMLFRSLLLVHPFGGTHPRIDELPDRAAQKITVLDPGVIYPAVGLPPELITDDLLHVFNKYFKENLRNPFPQVELEKFRNLLFDCPSCNTSYPTSRRVCPVCKAQNKVANISSIPGSLTVKKLLNLSGQILYQKLENDTLILLSLENNQVVLYLLSTNRVDRFPLFPYQIGMRFEASSKLLAVNISGTNDIDLFSVGKSSLQPLERSFSDLYFSTQNAVFRVNGSHLYRLVGSQLIDSEVSNGRILNRSLRHIIKNQSWFALSSDNSPLIVGFHRVLRQQFFWLFSSTFSADLSVPELLPSESLLDLTVKFSQSSALIIRKTKFRGEEFVYFDSFNHKGQSLYSLRLEVKKLPTEEIHGIAYAGGKLVFPTDLGAVRFDPVTNSQTNFSATNKVITSGQIVFPYEAGLLVINSQQVLYLILN